MCGANIYSYVCTLDNQSFQKAQKAQKALKPFPGLSTGSSAGSRAGRLALDVDPPPQELLAAAAHVGDAGGVVAGAVVRVGVGGGGGADATGAVVAVGPVDGGEGVLLVRGGDHVLGGLGQPAVDEVAVGGEGGARGQFQRRLPRPAVGQGAPDVVPDAEAQLRHALHVAGAPVGRAVRGARVRRLERGLVDAVREVEQRLQVRRARGRREGGDVLVGRGLIVLAEPLDARVRRVGRHGLGRLRPGRAGRHVEVLGDRHLGRGDAGVVVRREAAYGHGRVGRGIRVSGGGGEERWDP